MGNNILWASVFVSMLLFSASDGSDIYKEIYDRARQRTTRTLLKKNHKYTAEHDELLKDVVKSYAGDQSNVRQFEIFDQLLAELGMTQISMSAFSERALALRRETGDISQEGNSREPKVRVETWKKFLDSLFQENPTISGSAALRALESQSRCSDNLSLPSVQTVRRWLKLRRAKPLSRLEEEEREVFLCNEDVVANESENGAEAYMTLLTRARERRSSTSTVLKGHQKYTSAHDELIMDMVKTTLNGRQASRSDQYEIFKKLIKDLDMVNMSRGAFDERSAAARRFLLGSAASACGRKPTMGEATSRFLEALFEENPKISEKDVLQALESMQRPLPTRATVRYWLKYRRSRRRLAERCHSSSSSSSFREIDDADVWREVALALADDGGENNLEDDAEFWEQVSSVLEDEPHGERSFSGRNIIHDEEDREGSSAHRESSRKRKRDVL